MDTLGPLLNGLREAVAKTTNNITTKRPIVSSKREIVPRDRQIVSGDGTENRLGAGELKILSAIAQHQDGVTREQLTVLTGYKRSSRDTYLQRLQSAGSIVSEGGRIHVTQAGVDMLGDRFELLPTGHKLQAYWQERLTGGERVLFEVITRAYPNSIERDTLSEQTGYKRSSRDTYLQRLVSRQLITTDRGAVRASELLFD